MKLIQRIVDLLQLLKQPVWTRYVNAVLITILCVVIRIALRRWLGNEVPLLLPFFCRHSKQLAWRLWAGHSLNGSRCDIRKVLFLRTPGQVQPPQSGSTDKFLHLHGLRNFGFSLE